MNRKSTEMEFRGAQPQFMENKKLIQFVESIILLPVLTISAPMGDISQISSIVSTSQIVSLEQKNMEVTDLLSFNQELDQETKIFQAKAEAIDLYFRERGMPLEGMGTKLVSEAEDNNLDWRLLAAIAIRESTGGKFKCKKVENNPFGWGSCKIGFSSYDEAIEIVAKNLGGKNPNTAKHYAGKTTEEILRAYNPPSIVPHYVKQVEVIMDAISKLEISLETEVIAEV